MKLYCPQAGDIVQRELGFMILGDSTNIFHNVVVGVDNTFCCVSFFSVFFFFYPYVDSFSPCNSACVPKCDQDCIGNELPLIMFNICLTRS